MKTGYPDLVLTPSLVFEDGTAVPNIPLSIAGTPTIVNGRATLKCTISVVSMDVGNRKVCVLLTPNTTSTTAMGELQPVRSGGMLVIRHKLVLEIPPGTWDKTWYKVCFLIS